MLGKMHIKTSASILALCVIMLIFSPLAAKAQRTMEGQGLIDAKASVHLLRIRDWGMSISYGQYLLKGYWYAELAVSDNRISTDNHLSMRYIDLLGYGGYMHRLLSSRSRWFSLYAGGGAFLGYEFYDPLQELPTSVSTELPAGSFLYGLEPQVEAEMFFYRNVAFTTGLSLPVNFSSPLTKFRPVIRLGIRVNI